MLSILPPRPTDLGFPDKFHSWRNTQPESIEQSILNTKRVMVHCAPTGFGKSQCYMTEAVMSSGRTCIVTPSKGHQDQLIKDYGSMGLVDIRGKDNYECTSKAGWTCKDGFAGKCPNKGTAQCGYSSAYNAARASKYIVTSYKFWVAVHKYGMGLGIFSLVVFDEADNCPEELADSVQVKLGHHEIEETLGRKFPPPSSPGSEWKIWASSACTTAKNMYNQKKSQIEGAKDPRPSWVKDYHHLKNLVQKLATVALMRTSDWVWEEFDWGWQFDPIKFHKYTESRLFLKVPKISMFSATIRPKTLHMLGIGNDEVTFIDHPSVFPPGRSPLYYIPTMRVDRNSDDFSQLVTRVDQIMGPRLNLQRNGVVQVTSFKYRDEIVRQSSYRRSIISHWNGTPVADAVERFRNNGGVLVSPSVSSGYDFPDDFCRFQIITKIPWEPKSKVIAAREEIDSTYGPYNAMRSLVQRAGRGSRSEEDWCENFLLDDHAKWFCYKYGFLAPQWFWQRYKTLVSVPLPLQVLSPTKSIGGGEP